MFLLIPATTINVAHNEHAIQSSDWSSPLAADKAVDGNLNTFSCTLRESNNYWSVDLGVDVNIDHLYIKNIYASIGGELYLLKT